MPRESSAPDAGRQECWRSDLRAYELGELNVGGETLRREVELGERSRGLWGWARRDLRTPTHATVPRGTARHCTGEGAGVELGEGSCGLLGWARREIRGLDGGGGRRSCARPCSTTSKCAATGNDTSKDSTTAHRARARRLRNGSGCSGVRARFLGRFWSLSFFLLFRGCVWHGCWNVPCPLEVCDPVSANVEESLDCIIGVEEPSVDLLIWASTQADRSVGSEGNCVGTAFMSVQAVFERRLGQVRQVPNRHGRIGSSRGQS